MTPPGMGLRDWALLLLLSAIWGASFVFVHVLVEVLPPLTVVFARLTLAAAAMLVFTRGLSPEALRRWPEFLVLAFISTTLPFSLIAFGQTRIPSGLASILNATTPIFAVLAGHALTQDEKLSWGRTVGVAAGFIGVAVLIGPSALSSTRSDVLPGELACLAASLCYGFSGLYARRFRALPPLQVAAGQLLAAALLAAPLSLAIDRPFALPPLSLTAWGALVAVALPCTAFAYLLYYRVLASAGATSVSLVTFLIPPSAILLGVIFLGERLELRSLAGLALIGLGLAALDGRPIRWLKTRLTAA